MSDIFKLIKNYQMIKEMLNYIINLQLINNKRITLNISSSNRALLNILQAFKIEILI